MRRPWPDPVETAGAARLRPSFAEAVRRLDLRFRGLADSILHGDRLSGFPGRGLEAVGVREYRAGDEARGIDWRVTARKGRLHVREFDEERDLPFLILLHRSPTLRGGRSGIKEVRAIEVAGLLAAVALRGGDRVGVLQGGEDRGGLLRPGRRKGQLLRVLAALLDPPAGATNTSLSELLTLVNRVGRERHRVFLVGDFHLGEGALAQLQQGLLSVRARHALTPVRVRDPGEGVFGHRLGIDLRDPGTGRVFRSAGRGGETLREGLDRDEQRVEALFREMGLREWRFEVGSPLAGRLQALMAGDRWRGDGRV